MQIRIVRSLRISAGLLMIVILGNLAPQCVITSILGDPFPVEMLRRLLFVHALSTGLVSGVGTAGGTMVAAWGMPRRGVYLLSASLIGLAVVVALTPLWSTKYAELRDHVGIGFLAATQAIRSLAAVIWIVLGAKFSITHSKPAVSGS